MTKANLVDTFRQSFSPLRLRNFRIYLGGQVVSLVGTWLQMTAQGWVVWQLSHSTTALGIVGMLGTLPILLIGPWAGVWADRLDRRKLLIATQVAAMLLAFILAFLTQMNAIQLWHVYALSALLGIVTALDMPAQQAFIGDLSGMGEVRRAVVLNGMMFQLSRMLGPALAGFIIGALGVAIAFWLNGLSFLAVIASLLVVRANQLRKVAGTSPLLEFWEGLRFIGRQPRLFDLILFSSLMAFFGLPIINILPSVATDVLHGQADVLGWLMAASGAGALAGTLIVVPIAQAQRRIGVVVAGTIVWMGAWSILLSLSTWLPLSFASLFFISLGAPVVLTTTIGMLQVLGPADMRARLLSTFFVVGLGMQPVASLFIGYSAEQFTTPVAIAVNGLLLVIAPVLILALRPGLSQWDVHAPAQPAVVREMAAAE